jgi:hypothetical protein
MAWHHRDQDGWEKRLSFVRTGGYSNYRQALYGCQSSKPAVANTRVSTLSLVESIASPHPAGDPSSSGISVVAKKILIGVGVVLVLLAVVIGVLGVVAPTELYVEREVLIDRPKDVVFENVKFVKSHGAWSPWEKRDPQIKKTYRGTDGEVGFVSAWVGNDQVGEGEQEITRIKPGERIDYELRFKKPMEETNHAWLVTEEMSDKQTKVRWGDRGEAPLSRQHLLPADGPGKAAAGRSRRRPGDAEDEPGAIVMAGVLRLPPWAARS